jgi:hypothetical protein
MQRVRQSLPYFKEFGWEPTIITVDEKFVEAYSLDQLLLETFPKDIKIHEVSALKASITRKVGLGSLSIRSFFHIKKKGDALLQAEHFDLIYFSTTAFHVMALGPRWKRKFGVPFILDIQDPWYNTFYFANALSKKTTKARLYHELDRRLEKRTLPFADGIISVSSGYRDLYMKRYSNLPYESFKIIPFGCATLDFQIAEKHVHSSEIQLSEKSVNIVYVGRGGHDMEFATEIIFDAINIGLEKEPALFKKVRLWFIGTSYAQAGKGYKTIQPIADRKGLANQVSEITDRIPYFETLYLLSKADMLCVPGSSDPTYTASKIYPYIYTNKPMLAVFHQNSSVVDVIRDTSQAKVVTFGKGINEQEKQTLAEECFAYLVQVLTKKIKNSNLNYKAFEEFTARSMTEQQVNFFDQVTDKIPVKK